MNIGPLSNLPTGYVQAALQGTALADSATGSTLSGIDPSPAIPQPANLQLSPLAQILSRLQQLQQSDPTKYAQVTQQIATNLQKAANAAQSNGNTTAANALSQLAADFTNASKTGQLPNIQDLAQAVGGHHRHHHAHARHASGDAPGSASESSQTLGQLLSAFLANTGQNPSSDATGIILNTLSDAGAGNS